ncbi:MAG TPA: ABC transporter permease [Lacipirellulaceae bacterium]|nr:ABC transporter permease [Lacipirellulaceae bacterium]
MKTLFLILIALIFTFLLAPLVIVVAVSFGAEPSVSFPPKALSLHWYAQAFELKLFRQGLLNSVVIGGLAASASALLGLGAATAIARLKFRGRAALEAVFLSPLIVPGVLFGIALLAASAQIGLHASWVKLVLAHIVITLPYAVRMILTSYARFDTTYEEAAATLGASAFQTFCYVTLPMIRPGLIAGALFGFVISFDNVPVSIFLVDADTTTIPIAIMSYLEYNFDPSVAAISSVLIVSMLGIALALERIVGLRKTLGT